MDNVTIRGSWGDLIVHRATGMILERRDDSGMTGDDIGYGDILFFLPETLAVGRDPCLDHHGETDILYVGFVDDQGRVTLPMMFDEPEGTLIDPVLLPAPGKAGPIAAAVYFHAWKTEDGYQTHCDPHEAEGWCVYTRHEGDEGGAFDLSDERDYSTRGEAEREAESRATRLGVEVREY